MPLPIGPIVAGVAARAAAKRVATVTVKKTKSGIKKTGSVTKKVKPESTSYRGKELTKAERKKITAQNKSADTLRSKDLDRVESGKAGAQTKKRNQRRRELGMYAKGTAGGVALTSGLYAIANKDKDKKKSTKKK
jgi:hypothetical protein